MAKRIIKIRQSSLKDWLLCPERFRAVYSGEVEDQGSDAALTGTCVHTYIERRVEGMHPEEAAMAALTQLRDEWDSVAHVKVKNLGTAENHLLNCCRTWEEQVYPWLPPPILEPEHHFSIPVIVLDGVEVHLSGTIDYVAETPDGIEVYDWKSGGNLEKYQDGYGKKGWELRRWDIQSTVYTWAASQILGEPVNDFTFVAMHRTQPEHAVLSVQRGEPEWGFMKVQAIELATNIIAMPSAWQRNNQHALCSEKWCPNWHNCVGQFAEGLTTPSYNEKAKQDDPFAGFCD